MPAPTLIVSVVTSVQQTGPAGAPISIDFAGGQCATLDTAQREGPFFRRALDASLRVGLAVAVQVDPDTGAITDLWFPVSGRVLGLFRDSDGGLTVLLDSSARYYILDPQHPNRHTYEQLLVDAELDDAAVNVTEDEDGHIVDIRRRTEPDALVTAAPQPSPLLRTVTQDRAAQLFGMVASKSCDPADPAPDCIPFLYPDNGCNDRASAMCRILEQAGEAPRKVWNFALTRHAPLTLQTRNAPHCQVQWCYHVAVGLYVEVADNQPELHVLDPSIFPDGPVPAAQWQAAQQQPNSVLAVTTPEPYLPPVPEHTHIDPDYKNTDKDLVMWRLKLERRAGKLPYPCPQQKTANPAP